MKINYSYLPRQFSKIDRLLKKIKSFVKTGDFTLGKPLQEFEKRFAKLMQVKHAIGVNSGTDAIKLSLKSLGIGYGDEVITASNTFIATVGAINEIGAKPILVDCDETFCMDVNLIEKAITKKTKAIVPVHFTGYMTDMLRLQRIAKKYKLIIVEDACQSILAEQNKKKAGTWGKTGCFSLHPLKNLNVWSDGGIIITNSDSLNKKLRLLRNHGMKNRNEVEVLGFNSRLDTIQAVVGNWLIPKTKKISEVRIKNAQYYDYHFSKIKELRIPKRPKRMRIVFHLYMIFAEQRDRLLDYCLKHKVEAKIHYPIPLYQQKALKKFGYKKGDFPVTDSHCKNIINFPVDQHMTKKELDYVIKIVKAFYEAS